MTMSTEVNTPLRLSASLPTLLEPVEPCASSDDDDSGNYNPEAENEYSLAISQN